jgi:hypothetical protein
VPVDSVLTGKKTHRQYSQNNTDRLSLPHFLMSVLVVVTLLRFVRLVEAILGAALLHDKDSKQECSASTTAYKKCLENYFNSQEFCLSLDILLARLLLGLEKTRVTGLLTFPFKCTWSELVKGCQELWTATVPGPVPASITLASPEPDEPVAKDSAPKIVILRLRKTIEGKSEVKKFKVFTTQQFELIYAHAFCTHAGKHTRLMHQGRELGRQETPEGQEWTGTENVIDVTFDSDDAHQLNSVSGKCECCPHTFDDLRTATGFLVNNYLLDTHGRCRCCQKQPDEHPSRQQCPHDTVSGVSEASVAEAGDPLKGSSHIDDLALCEAGAEVAIPKAAAEPACDNSDLTSATVAATGSSPTTGSTASELASASGTTAGAVRASGATGEFAARVNGLYELTGDVHNEHPLFRKVDEPNRWLFFAGDENWWFSDTDTKREAADEASGWAVSAEPNLLLPQDATAWEVWDGTDFELQTSLRVTAVDDEVQQTIAHLQAATEPVTADSTSANPAPPACLSSEYRRLLRSKLWLCDILVIPDHAALHICSVLRFLCVHAIESQDLLHNGMEKIDSVYMY